LASPEVVRQLDYMILVISFQLKDSYSILFYPTLSYPIPFSVPGRLSTGRCLAR